MNRDKPLIYIHFSPPIHFREMDTSLPQCFRLGQDRRVRSCTMEPMQIEIFWPAVKIILHAPVPFLIPPISHFWPFSFTNLTLFFSPSLFFPTLLHSFITFFPIFPIFSIFQSCASCGSPRRLSSDAWERPWDLRSTRERWNRYAHCLGLPPPPLSLSICCSNSDVLMPHGDLEWWRGEIPFLGQSEIPS